MTEYVLQTGTDSPFDGIDVGTFATPTFADIDGDGDLDLIIGQEEGVIALDEEGGILNYQNAGGILKYYVNDGGTYTEVTGSANPFDGVDVRSESAPTFADIDDDGDLDLVVGEQDGGLHYYVNDGGVYTEATGSANPFDDIDVGYLVYRSTPVFVDLDGDDDLDLVVGSSDGFLLSYINDGGTYTRIPYTDDPFYDIGLDIRLDGIYLRFPDSTPTFADVDGDGDLDLVVGETDGTLNYFVNDGGTYTDATGSDNPFAGIDVGWWSAPTFADVDGDGDLDLVVGEYLGDLYYYENVNTFTGAEGNDSLEGGHGHDTLEGFDGNDILSGGAGNDTLYGYRGDDILYGGDGNDLLGGGSGHDTVEGGDGNDLLRGYTGRDVLEGGNGDDVLEGGNGDDSLDGGAGNDALEGGDGNDFLSGGAGHDTLEGGDGNDFLAGGAGNDTLWGYRGDDILAGGAGNDLLGGGSGDDTVEGGDGNDFLRGYTGRDVLEGGNGLDVLDGGAGNDILTGGDGHDTFVFNANAGADVVSDFEDDLDTVQFSSSDFTQTTGQEIIDAYGRLNADGDAVLDFGDGDSMTFVGIADVNDLADDIVLL